MKLEHLKTKRIILFKIKGMLNSWPYGQAYNIYTIPYMITVYIYQPPFYHHHHYFIYSNLYRPGQYSPNHPNSSSLFSPGLAHETRADYQLYQ